MNKIVYNAEEALKLIDNGYKILLFRDGLGDVSALAVPKDKSVDVCVRQWVRYEPEEDITPAECVFYGPNRNCGGGRTVAVALQTVTEKVLFNRLPGQTDGYRLYADGRYVGWFDDEASLIRYVEGSDVPKSRDGSPLLYSVATIRNGVELSRGTLPTRTLCFDMSPTDLLKVLGVNEEPITTPSECPYEEERNSTCGGPVG